MKMTKKILLGAVAVATLALTGCNLLDFGAGDLKGTKYKAEMTVDGTDEAKEPLETAYRRFFKHIGTNKQVVQCEYEVTVNDISKIGNSVAGLAFDVHEKSYKKGDIDGDTLLVGGKEYELKAGDKLIDFVLIGFKNKNSAGNRVFYLERYVNIPKQLLKESTEDDKSPLDTNAGSIGQYYTFDGTNWDTTLYGRTGSDEKTNWLLANDKTILDYDTEKDTITFTITISQAAPKVKDKDGWEPSPYVVKIGGKKLGSYVGETRRASGDYEGYACGGIGCYGNCYKDSKLVVNFEADSKADINATLFAEVDE